MVQAVPVVPAAARAVHQDNSKLTAEKSAVFLYNKKVIFCYIKNDSCIANLFIHQNIHYEYI
jgi:hypothetical protein